jgi:hypothetical protein
MCYGGKIFSTIPGLPLKRGQARRFRIRVDDVPDGADEVLVLITNVDVE